jgi:hypothetical protein
MCWRRLYALYIYANNVLSHNTCVSQYQYVVCMRVLVFACVDRCHVIRITWVVALDL